MTEHLWHTGKVVILDSGFCVVKGLIELQKKGVFASALIKKRRYWPKYVDGNAIKAHFNDKEVGDTDALKCSLDSLEYHVFAMKEPNYVSMLMSTYGTLDRSGGKTTKRAWKDENSVRREATFRYPEVQNNHFLYRHYVDDHNSKRMDPISLEETWNTTRWPCCVYSFLLAITEVNVFLCDKNHNGAYHSSYIAFRKQFAKELIFNEYLVPEGESPRRTSARRAHLHTHELLTLPPNKKFRQDGAMVHSDTTYAQRKCACGNRVRTYCKCSPGLHRCAECYALHTRGEERTGST